MKRSDKKKADQTWQLLWPKMYRLRKDFKQVFQTFTVSQTKLASTNTLNTLWTLKCPFTLAIFAAIFAVIFAAMFTRAI